MSISSMISNWSESIIVQAAGTKNKYNQCAYTETTISGRLVQTEKEIQSYKNARQERNMGDKVLAVAKLFTTTLLSIDSKVGDYKIISIKACKDKNNTLKFYKYYLE